MPRVLRRCAWDERGSRNEKVVSSRHLDCNYLHPPSISIPLCSRSGGLRCCRGNGFLHEERLYQLTFTRHRRPVFHSFLYPRNLWFSAPGFDTQVTTGSSGRDWIEAFRRYLLVASDSSRNDNNQTRLDNDNDNAIAFSWKFFSSEKAFFYN